MRRRSVTRRQMLLATLPVALLALPACDGGSAGTRAVLAQSPDPTPTPTPVPPPAPTATPRPTPRPLMLRVPDLPVPQGGSFLIALTGDGVSAATVEFAGWRFPMIAEGDGWLAIVGAGQPIGVFEQLPTGNYPVRVLVEPSNGSAPLALSGAITLVPTQFPVESLTFTPQVSQLLTPDNAEMDYPIMRAAYGVLTPARLWDGLFQRPSPAPITDVFGSRRSYNGGPPTGSHSGVDFGGDTGEPATAAARGRVALVRRMVQRGNMVVLDHGAGVFTGYCHLAAFAVSEGQEVQPGDVVGYIGATGLVTGPHLHWDVVVGGIHVDGLRWLGV